MGLSLSRRLLALEGFRLVLMAADLVVGRTYIYIYIYIYIYVCVYIYIYIYI